MARNRDLEVFGIKMGLENHMEEEGNHLREEKRENSGPRTETQKKTGKNEFTIIFA